MRDAPALRPAQRTHCERVRAPGPSAVLLSDKNGKRQIHSCPKPHPGLWTFIVTGRSSGLPSSFPDLAFPCDAQWRLVKVVRLTAAGTAPDWREVKTSRVTGFPFHPSADKQKGTFHVLLRILQGNRDNPARKKFLEISLLQGARQSQQADDGNHGGSIQGGGGQRCAALGRSGLHASLPAWVMTSSRWPSGASMYIARPPLWWQTPAWSCLPRAAQYSSPSSRVWASTWSNSSSLTTNA